METKKKMPKGITDEQAKEAMAAYANCTAQIGKLDAQAKIKIAEIERELAEKKTALATDASDAYNILEVYANENPEKFEEKKSLELPGGMIGFRSGKATIAEKEGFTMEEIIKKVEKIFPDFIKVSKSLVKASINAKITDSTVVKKLEKCGLEVKDAEETFFVKAA
jgi:hypothetical protein